MIGREMIHDNVSARDSCWLLITVEIVRFCPLFRGRVTTIISTHNFLI